jgi:hypothetical protein
MALQMRPAVQAEVLRRRLPAILQQEPDGLYRQRGSGYLTCKRRSRSVAQQLRRAPGMR